MNIIFNISFSIQWIIIGQTFSLLFIKHIMLLYKWIKHPASIAIWKILWLDPNKSNFFGYHFSGILNTYIIAPAIYTAPPNATVIIEDFSSINFWSAKFII